MKKLYKKLSVLTLSLASLVTIPMLTSSFVQAQSSYSSSDSYAGFTIVFMVIYFLFICLFCLNWLCIFVHSILAIICLLDIAKYSEQIDNKEFWIIIIVFPGTFPLLNAYGGGFISVIAEIYYLIKVSPNLVKN